MHEGFQNLPTLYGSQVRRGGEVHDFESGVKEGAKVSSVAYLADVSDDGLQELFYGFYDGITGLVTEPLRGAQKEVGRSVRLVRMTD